MSDLWANLFRTWDLIKAPLRPPADVVDVMKRLIDTDRAEMALLGVTPELARLGKSLVAIDANPHMIGALWIGDSATRKVVLGNWLDLPLLDNSIDAIVGDGCLSAVTSEAQRLRCLEEMARVLRPGGRAAIRLFARPAVTEPLDAIRADALGGRIKALAEIVLRAALSLPAAAPDYGLKMSAVLDAINEMFGDRKELMAAGAWEQDAFAFIDLYQGSDTICCWLNEAIHVAEAARYFADVRLVPSGTYPVADRCPILLLGSPHR
ncbi:class I SAM-dependent methyltransferase [Mesorhizobium loti]|uniref:Class I SAM-dependent methyltransferase n=1 Tax=Mesorhizobium loti R88b TaxID=935548 RepID=A0A6M7WN17_RHILI|nr:class I SAM-dependent methyltransferase [Mesorhizobium loti]QKD03365.1 class I SAM-dependent methyltransferase [Mesorhizobium loti R88b]